MVTNTNDPHDSSSAGARTSDIVKLAEERARRADRELVAAEDDVAQAEAAVAAVEPGSEGFDQRTARCDEARRRRDELRDRTAFANRAVEVERERARAAERAALRADLEITEGHLRAGDEEIVREALKFIVELREAFGVQADYGQRAARIDVQLGNPPRLDRSYFANVEAGSELMALLNHIEIVREAMTAAQNAKEEEKTP